ncbi:ATP-binding protein [Psittacicella hinzii]|uniref:ATP-binding protein n=1 Tax=Psittacicella hinzii TaxID=2028575 RepID=UPI001CA731EB|nr:ATP-binding protein [Psittacicella hinzii]
MSTWKQADFALQDEFMPRLIELQQLIAPIESAEQKNLALVRLSQSLLSKLAGVELDASAQVAQDKLTSLLAKPLLQGQLFRQGEQLAIVAYASWLLLMQEEDSCLKQNFERYKELLLAWQAVTFKVKRASASNKEQQISQAQAEQLQLALELKQVQNQVFASWVKGLSLLQVESRKGQKVDKGHEANKGQEANRTFLVKVQELANHLGVELQSEELGNYLSWLQAILTVKEQITQQESYLAFEQQADVAIGSMTSAVNGSVDGGSMTGSVAGSTAGSNGFLPIDLAISGGKDSLALYWTVLYACDFVCLTSQALALLVKEQSPVLNSVTYLDSYQAYQPQGSTKVKEHFYQTVEFWQELFAGEYVAQALPNTKAKGREIGISHVDHGLQQIAQNWASFTQEYTNLTQQALRQFKQVFAYLKELDSFYDYYSKSLKGFSGACSFHEYSPLGGIGFNTSELNWVWRVSPPSLISKLKMKLAHLTNTENYARNLRYGVQFARLASQGQKRALLFVAHQEQDKLETFASSILRLYPQEQLNESLISRFLQEVEAGKTLPIMRNLQAFTYEEASNLVDQQASEQADKQAYKQVDKQTDIQAKQVNQTNQASNACTIVKARPLLALERQQVEAILQLVGTLAVEDPMNQEKHYTRVAVRQALESNSSLEQAVKQAYQANQTFVKEKVWQESKLLKQTACLRLGFTDTFANIISKLKETQDKSLAEDKRVREYKSGEPNSSKISDSELNSELIISDSSSSELCNSELTELEALNLYPHLLKEQILAWDYQQHLALNLEATQGLNLINFWLWLQAKVQLNLSQYQQLVQLMQAPETKAPYFSWVVDKASKSFATIIRHQGYLLLINDAEVGRFINTSPASRASLFQEQTFALGYNLQLLASGEYLFSSQQRIIFPLKADKVRFDKVGFKDTGVEKGDEKRDEKRDEDYVGKPSRSRNLDLGDHLGNHLGALEAGFTLKFASSYLESSAKFNKLLRSRAVPWLWSQFIYNYCIVRRKQD